MACVGDSITFGHGIANRERDTYPCILDSLMGPGYDVRNFGISGYTLMNSGDMPYTSTPVYQEALDFMPDIVTIALGTNDSKAQNWINSQDFKDDFRTLIASFRNLESHPQIWVCLPPPAMGNAWGINDSIISNGVIPYIREIAESENVGLIDLNTPFQSKPQYFPDTIHPNEAGQSVIAETVMNAIMK